MGDPVTVPTLPREPHRHSPQSPFPILRVSDPNYSVEDSVLQEPHAQQPGTLPEQLGAHFSSSGQSEEHQPSSFELAWPAMDNHLLLSIIVTILVLMCGNGMSLVCTFIAMVLSCSALYDDITNTHSRLPKANVSFFLSMAALLLMAIVWQEVLRSNEVSAGGGGGRRPACSSAMFCTIRSCPFFPFGYSYRYRRPITHSACFCSDV